MKYSKSILMLMAAMAMFFTACDKDDDDAEKQARIDEQVIQDYLEANNINATRHESGMYYLITDEGDGEHPTVNSTVEVFYEGYFTDGSIFDRTTGAPASFPLSNLITGWKIGIPLVKESGSITLFLPSALGYGETGSGSVPPNTVIIFDIDLVTII